MKHLLLFICCFPILFFGQCPPTGGIFTTQAQIDALSTDYPDCTEVGAFIISGDDIIDLSGLSQIYYCTSFAINDNPMLETTAGLNPNIIIRYVEGTGTSFAINNNASLLSVDGLDNLVSQSGFESSFSISDNPNLLTVQGAPDFFDPLTYFYIQDNTSLVNLVGLEDYGAGEVTVISNNDSLIDLTGLEDLSGEFIRISDNDNLQTLNGPIYSWYDDYLYIENNQNLTDISGIWLGNFLIVDLIVRNNPNLAMCSDENACQFFNNILEEYESLRGVFENNAPGCNSVFEAEYGCGVNTNDNCGYSPFQLTPGVTITANNEFATTSSQTPSCNDLAGRKDVWFSYYPEEDGEIDIILEPGFYVQMWEGECFFNLTQVPNGCGTGLSNMPVLGNPYYPYYFQIWNDDTLDRGGSSWFDLSIQDSNLSTPEFTINEVKLFPNPVNDVLTIESGEAIEKVEVFNLVGQLVVETHSSHVDFSGFSKGMYLVQVFAEGRQSTFKVLKD